MKAKEFLSQYLIANRQIEQKLDRAKRLREEAEKITASLGNDISNNGRSTDKVGNIVSAYVDLEREITERINALREMNKEIETVIDRVENERERLVLLYRYVNGMKWEEIAEVMHYSRRNVTVLHGHGIISVEKIMSAE